MKVKDLRSGLRQEMDALVPDVLAQAKSVPINNMLQHGSSEQQFRQRVVMRMLFATCCMFFSVLIVTSAFLISNFMTPPERASLTYVNLYVTPCYGEDIDPADYNSFELNIVVNSDDTVRFVRCGSDGKEIAQNVLNGLGFRNKNYKTFVQDVLKKTYTLNLYDTGDETLVSISSLNDIDGLAAQIRNNLQMTCKNFYLEKTRTADVSVGSATKTGLYNWAVSVNPNSTATMSIDELVFMIESVPAA